MDMLRLPVYRPYDKLLSTCGIRVSTHPDYIAGVAILQS